MIKKKRQTSMPPVAFELTIPASERPSHFLRENLCFVLQELIQYFSSSDLPLQLIVPLFAM